MADKDREKTPLAREDEALLDSLFAAAKDDAAADPTPDFMARVLADAEAAMPVSNPVAQAAEVPRASFVAKAVALLGGWQSVSGLAAATVAGVWIGVAAGPAMLQSDIGTSLIVSSEETYLSALDASYAFLGN
ncbi:hypothetical protein BXY66_2237 [Shimia isoporae]|uniref:Dihydroorotate dehydrogenase n=1 Tax=Shimia isoporae TaxID=647720 RepID=A0A4R1NY19_9RHOB|nr:hypothetical protein [Shimia isoporae]TCL10168.1 hypothetical protein BXY66_2237 [Shimia isoporae]